MKPTGFERIGRVLESRLPPAERLALIVVAHHVNDKTGVAFPSLELVGRQMGASRETAKRVCRRLREWRILLVVKPARQHRAPHYCIDYDALAEWQPVPRRVSVTPLEPRQTTVAPLEIVPGANSDGSPVTPLSKSRRVTWDRQTGHSCDPLTGNEQVSLRSSEPIGSSDLLSAAKGGDLSAGQNTTRKALEEHFISKTCVPPPKVNTERQRREAGVRWWAPLREIAELVEWREEDALRLLDAALARMDGLTVSAPQSVINVARSIVGEVARGAYRPDGMAKGLADLAYVFQEDVLRVNFE